MDQVFTYDAFVHAIAGTVGGQVAMSAFYPLDILRTYMQVNENLKGKSSLQVTRAIIQEEGTGALYKGLGPVLGSLAASNFIYFYTNNMLKALVRNYTQQKNVTTGQNLLIASAAGCVNVLTTCPLWVVSARLKTQKGSSSSGSGGRRSGSGKGGEASSSTSTATTTSKALKPYNGFIDGLIRISQEEGIGALWNGCMASLVLVSNPTIQFVAYDAIRRFAVARANRDGRKSLTTWEIFILGAVAKAIATFVTYPLQVAQSKLRNSNKNLTGEDAKSSGIRSYKNTLDCLIQMFQADGFYGWYKGLNVKLLQTVLMAAFHFLAYEKVAALIFALFGKTKVAASH